MKDYFGEFEKILKLAKTYFGDDGEVGRFMRKSHPDLDGVSPMELVLQGKGQIVVDMIEDALLGHPS